MFLVKNVDLVEAYPTPFTVCRYDTWFSRYDGGADKATARNRTFQSPPGIGLIRALPVGHGRLDALPLRFFADSRHFWHTCLDISSAHRVQILALSQVRSGH